MEIEDSDKEAGDRSDLERELEAEKQRSAELLNRLRYMQADLENYRKRADREVREAGESALRPLALKLLAVVDELDLALMHADKGEGGAELREGLAMVRKNFDSALESAGVERIECLGRPFDPAYHEAVERVQGDPAEGDVVVEELRPGFTFRGQLLRPSMVKVGAPSGGVKEGAKA